MKMTTSSRMFNWVQQLDFAGPRINTSIWGWGLLVMGLSVMLAAADQAQSVRHDLESEHLSLLRLQRVEHQRKLAAMPMRGASSPALAWSSEALQSAQGVVSLLAYPWSQLFDQVEKAALEERALLLTLALDQDRSLTDARTPVVIRLTAAVANDESALRWAGAHGAGSQLLSRERLGAPAPSPQGDYLWRAELSWLGPQP